ncbi:sulfatase-like hydrolase/transferase [Haloferula sp. A504]|uniref:sulfatase-like hydrolase/transferase n=1 Tax=Haloferula sp. A504 TaxID=3373601 RepID=UPI0031CC32CB|nr:sulfatase-like hydrolase/transferase [Verrucomicrobiaceae bacterium E54]
MSRLRATGLACLVVAWGSVRADNVLLIIADDLGTDSLSGFNVNPTASFPPTPTIDGLRAQGLAFGRFYAYPTCSPTRASIMTGRHAFRTGVLAPEINQLQPNDFTLPEALVASGVIGDRLACIGKWHLGNDADSPNEIGGWPHFVGTLGGALLDYDSFDKVVDGVTVPNSAYATTENVNDAVAWIDARGTESWFLWLAFNAPHTPLHRPPNDLHDYDSISDDGAPGSRDHYEAMVQAMDTEIGRLLGAVDLAETTVIFMGDNGTSGRVIQPPFASDHAKGSLYEGGIRVPMVIAGAAVDPSLAGTAYDGIIHACDLYATILELFGVVAADVVPQELVLDSRSFAPLLDTGAYSRDPADVMALTPSSAGTADGDRTIVGQEFKFILREGGAGELYRVDANPREAVNFLAGTLNASQQAAYDDLTARLAGYANQPEVHRMHFDGEGGFNLELGWFANASLTLERGLNLVGWEAVPGAEIIDNGDPVIILRDPAPPDDRAFYRVVDE